MYNFTASIMLIVHNFAIERCIFSYDGAVIIAISDEFVPYQRFLQSMRVADDD